jgi:uncharacterized NAD-dependent epimerase/dehydratase family protein
VAARIGDQPGIGLGSRFLVLAEGLLTDLHGKLAHGVLRFRPDSAAAVIDSTWAGRATDDVVAGFPSVPIVASVREGLAFEPTALLLGATPAGGVIPPGWRPAILESIEAGLDVIAGMHLFLADDAELAAAAKRRGVRLVDLRRPPDELRLAEGRVLDLPETRVVLTVGSDAAVGKMTTALRLCHALERAGETAAFVATGQTGIVIAGWGVAIDRVIGDFMPGVTEELVLRAAEDARYVVVEGQGSIAHPAFSAVTLALLHGAAPTDLVLCHDVGRTRMIEYERKPVPPLPGLVASYEELTRYLRPARVRCIAVNTSGHEAGEAAEILARMEREMGVPAHDPVRFGPDPLASALLDTEAARAR